MKKQWKRVAALAAGTALALSLSACGATKFDAAGYVEGLLRVTYLCENDATYMELVDIDEAEVQDTYNNNIEVETENFLYVFDIEYPTDEMREQVQEICKEIYSHAKFEVVSAAEQSDGSFSVKVNIEPIDTMQLAMDKWDETMAGFYEKYADADFAAMSDEEYEAADLEYGRTVIDLFQSVVGETGNQPVKAVTISVEKDSDGYYGISDDDFYRLDRAIFDYDYDYESAGA